MTVAASGPTAAVASSFSFRRMQAWITSGGSRWPWMGWL